MYDNLGHCFSTSENPVNLNNAKIIYHQINNYSARLKVILRDAYTLSDLEEGVPQKMQEWRINSESNCIFIA